jgi:hypothetical protein
MPRRNRPFSRFLTAPLWWSFYLFLFISIAGSLFVPQNEAYFGKGSRSLLSITGETSPSNSWLHNLPRNTISGQSVTPSMCVTSASDYYSSFWAIVAVPLSLGVLAVLVGILFCCLRHCCDLCGGVDPTEENYSRKNKLTVKILLLVTSICLLAMIAVGIVGDVQFNPAIDNFANQVQVEAVNESALISSIKPLLDSIDLNGTQSKGFVTDLNQDANLTTNAANEGKTYLNDINLYREILLGFTWAVVLICIILASIGTFGDYGTPSLVAGYISFFGIFLIWFSFSVNFSLSVVMSDLCYDVEVYSIESCLENRVQTNGSYGVLGEICHCTNFVSTENTLIWTKYLESQVEQQINSTTNQTELFILNEQLAELQIIAGDLVYLKNCTWLISVFEPIGNTMCYNNMNGLVLLWGSCAALAFLMIPFTILSIMGYKRFMKDSDYGFF